MNKTIIMGRLTRDPELTYTKTNTAIAKFSIAVNDKFNKDTAFFFNCVAWDKKAKTICEYFKKGSRILIDGELKQSRWQTKEGQNRTDTFINVENITFVDTKSDNQQNASQGKPNINFQDEGLNPNDFNDGDEVPF